MSAEKIEELLDEAYMLHHSPAKVALLEEAARIADTVGEPPWSYGIRMEIIETGCFGGMHEKALVAFSWCLAAYDRDPEEYDEEDILWRYKWILDHMPAYPQISREQIVGMQDDFTRRLLAVDSSPRPAEYLRWSNLMRMGDLDQARGSYERWKDQPEDWLEDCGACEADKTVELMIRLHRDDDAMKAAKPLLEGRMGCAEVPHLTYGNIIRPLMRQGNDADAATMLDKGYRMISGNSEFLRGVAEQFIFLARTRDFRKGVPRLEKHLPWAVATSDIDAAQRFYEAVGLLLEAMAKEGKKSQRRFRLPEQLPCTVEDEQYNVAELAGWFASEAAKLADQFNRRNGNDYYTQLTHENRELAGL